MEGNDDALIAKRFGYVSKFLDERMRRLVAASEAKVAGYGGVSMVARVTGVSRRAIHIGLHELTRPPAATPRAGRIRKSGGGRKKTVSYDLTLKRELEAGLGSFG